MSVGPFPQPARRAGALPARGTVLLQPRWDGACRRLLLHVGPECSYLQKGKATGRKRE